jgi:DNA helicase-2/ATP-dependent DNA helicase PcrA
MKQNDLNPEQLKAVKIVDGPLLIIAGPGSGKTKTLVERIIHLVMDLKIQAENILVATFTEKAAKELITRVTNRTAQLGFDINLTEMYIGTLHSICQRRW